MDRRPLIPQLVLAGPAGHLLDLGRVQHGLVVQVTGTPLPG